MFPVAADEVNTTLPPVQKVIAPPAVIVGVVGNGFTVTTVAADDPEVQPWFTATENVPDAVTVIDCVVAPFDQMFPVAADEVNTTLPPSQNVVAPVTAIVGVVASGFTLTVVPADTAEVQFPLLKVTEYVPEVVTVIDGVVAPFDHTFPVAAEEVNTTLPPAQKVVGPPAVIVGVAGKALTVTVVPADAAEVQLPLSTETVYVPAADTVIDCVVAPFDQRFPVAAEEVNTTLPPVQKVVAPPAVIVGVVGAAVMISCIGVLVLLVQVVVAL